MQAADDTTAILEVLQAETDAWLRRDLDALASYWVHSPQARRLSSVANLGILVQEGWDDIFAAFKSMAAQFPQSFSENRVRREKMNIVVTGDSAWASFNQIGDKTDDDFEMVGVQHELRIFQRIDGHWKIMCNIVLQRAIDHETCPLVEVTSGKKVLWMNAAAHERLNENSLLVMSGGKLRAKNIECEKNLSDAVEWAMRNLNWHKQQNQSGRPSKPVVLGEDDNGTPIFCWVVIEDGKILVSFDDTQMVRRRIAMAKEIYQLTEAQAQLAELLAQGNDLQQAAQNLSVSINTVRTHLQRMFDRTGVRNQPALIAMLLSAEEPTR
jgi:DNA-binding CsgD family transcriptional regulator